MSHRSNMKRIALTLLAAGSLHAADFHIALSGKDTNAGTAAAPFATLERARMAVREWRKADGKGGATVWIESGVYPLASTFELGAEDSGTAESPILWRAKKDGAAQLDARRRIDAKDFHKVTDAALLARMADEARGKVWALDLAKTGIQHGKRPTDIFDNSGGLLDLYCDGERQTLSRLVLSLIQIPHASQKSAVWNRFDVRLPRPLLTGLGEFFAFILCAGHRACAATHSA